MRAIAVTIEGPAVLAHVQKFANAVCGATEACTISTYNGHSPTAARAIDILVSDVYGKVPTDGNKLGDTGAELDCCAVCGNGADEHPEDAFADELEAP